MASGGQDPDHRAADLTSALHAHRRAEHVERIDEDERRLESAVRAVEMDLDRLVTESAEGQELRRGFCRESVGEFAGD
jgi:hypothetical protein